MSTCWCSPGPAPATPTPEPGTAVPGDAAGGATARRRRRASWLPPRRAGSADDGPRRARRRRGGVGVGDRAAHPGRAAPRPVCAGVDGAPGEDAARRRRARHHHLHPARASWCWTRCAGSAPPSSKPSTTDRRAIGVEYETRWAEIARANLALAGPLAPRAGDGVHRRRPAPGLAPPARAARSGRAGGHLPAVRALHPRPGHHRRTPGCTSATTSTATCSTAGTWPTSATTGCWPGSPASSPSPPRFLRPGGHVVITVRPWREHAELIDLPAQIAACGRAAGLVPVERCVALLGRVTEQRRVRRAGLVLPTRLHPPPTRPRPTPAPDRPRRRHRPGPDSYPGVRPPPPPRPQRRPRRPEFSSRADRGGLSTAQTGPVDARPGTDPNP